MAWVNAECCSVWFALNPVHWCSLRGNKQSFAAGVVVVEQTKRGPQSSALLRAMVLILSARSLLVSVQDPRPATSHPSLTFQPLPWPPRQSRVLIRTIYTKYTSIPFAAATTTAIVGIVGILLVSIIFVVSVVSSALVLVLLLSAALPSALLEEQTSPGDPPARRCHAVRAGGHVQALLPRTGVHCTRPRRQAAGDEPPPSSSVLRLTRWRRSASYWVALQAFRRRHPWRSTPGWGEPSSARPSPTALLRARARGRRRPTLSVLPHSAAAFLPSSSTPSPPGQKLATSHACFCGGCL